ncbi:multifunctional CCA addition/repair protein [Acidiferrobacter thiooxydans]|uniref:multifunctional CCA addition/repair protein n=1 Tax=Acidiferrobacter thiooxydans TaxID=163359 RepID=UPI00082692EA|nr:multifunctional CCA addition/repair protein [Acidiferrobacter thiooxydans]
METYLVGGAVRDDLLGRPVIDRDYVVVGSTPQEMEARGFRRVGVDFPVFLHPETHCEYALARTERKTAPGYRGFAVHADPTVTLEEDLRRRDLTINAMARAEDGALIDPYGGHADLRAGILRHVSPAFAEDPVRILRVARFAARFGFTVAAETMTLMRAMVASGEASALVPERVFTELDRALGEPHPWLFVEVLRACGALAVQFPEIDRLFGIPQPPAHHPEGDTGVHVLLALRQTVRLGLTPRARFAVLLHDLGKGLTPRAEWPAHKGHEARGVGLVDAVCARLKAPVEYRALARAVAGYHLQVHTAMRLRPATVLRLIEAVDGFRRPGRFLEFLGACEADARGRSGLEDRPYPQAPWLRAARDAAAAVSGRDWAARGLAGDQIRERIRAARIDLIAALKTDEC